MARSGRAHRSFGLSDPDHAAVLARDPDEAVAAASAALWPRAPCRPQNPVADIVHKSEVGGVGLDLASEAPCEEAAADILGPHAQPSPMRASRRRHRLSDDRRPKARELIVGVADDPTFGPVIAFGQGGTAVEVQRSMLWRCRRSILIWRMGSSRARACRAFSAYRNVPAADERAIELLPGQALATCRRIFPRSAKSTQSGARRRDRRDRRRRADIGRAGQPRTAALRQPAFRHRALSDESGCGRCIARRQPDSSFGRCGPEDELSTGASSLRSRRPTSACASSRR